MTKTHARRAHPAEPAAHSEPAAGSDPARAIPGETPTQQVMAGFAEAYRAWMESLSAKPQAVLELQKRYFEDQARLWTHAFQPQGEAGAAQSDKRFAAPEWEQQPGFRFLRDSYLVASKHLLQSVEAADLDGPTRQRMRFLMRQYLDAVSPSNYLMTNPEALKHAMESGGGSLQEGFRNLLADLEKGRISMTDEAAFEVGRNVGTTAGAVVFENELIQLIQYQPLTPKVHERPLVMVPPCINKFYILDLQPENSMVRYALEQGLTVFMVSWRNVKPPLDTLTWDDYIEKGIVEALEQSRRLSGADKLNALGFCVGGTLLAAGLAVLEKKRANPVVSVTLMTTLLDFRDCGDIRVYIDQNFVEKRERALRRGGIVPGQELAASFSSLRANDLIWTYVVNNYLKGKAPPPFDLLYWNADSTNLPGPMYAYYIRNTYLENKLAQPDALTMCGVPVSLKRVRIPAFVFSAREDHIVPWKGGYESARTLGGPVTFVLGASGHIAGSINPPSKNKRSYWASGAALGPDAEQWLEGATEVPGSWWPAWWKWLKPHAGRLVPAPAHLGGAKGRVIEPAPGRYAKERVE